jgi:hypothetical protein
MDPRLYGKRGYDMDLTIFRSLFALDPNTNIPISTNLLMTSDGIGGIQWESLAWYTSTVSISNIKILDVNTANAIPVHNLTIQNGNLLVDGAGAIGSGISIIQLASSITGLGSAGYVSTTSLYSTVAGLGTAGYVSSATLTKTVAALGTTGYVSTVSLYSTVIGLGTAGYVSTAQFNSFSNFIYNPVSYISSGNLFSTSISLLGYIDGFVNSQGSAISSFTVTGTVNFFSTLSIGTFVYVNGNISTLSTSVGDAIVNLGTTPGYLSSLQSQVLSTGTIGLSSINFVDTVTGIKQLVAITNGIFQVNGASITGDVSKGDLTSTVIGLGTAGYLSTIVWDSVVSTANLTDLISTPNLTDLISSANLTGLISTANLTGLISTANLTDLISTANLNGLVNSANLTGLISTANLTGLISTANLTGLISTANLTRLVSTSFFDTQITSSLVGLGNLGFLSSFNTRNVSTGTVQASSITFIDINVPPSVGAGLPSLLYASSGKLMFNGAFATGEGAAAGVSQLIAGNGISLNPQIGTGTVTLTATIANMVGLISTPNVANIVSTANLNGLVSTSFFDSQITSSLNGLGTAGYISSSFFDSQITSSLNGLGTAGYISSTQLQSTVVALKQSFFVVNTDSLYLIGSGNTLVVSSLRELVYLSSFIQSTVTYKGSNGNITPQWNNGTQPISFTTANLQLDSFSTLITSRATVTIEVLGNFAFSPLGLAQSPVPIYMSSFVQSGVSGNSNYLSSQMFQSMFFPSNYNSGTAGGLYGSISNYFSPTIKMSIPGSVIQSFYRNAPLVLGHYLPNAVTLATTQGFLNSNASVFFGSTNSVFISVQNMP